MATLNKKELKTMGREELQKVKAASQAFFDAVKAGEIDLTHGSHNDPGRGRPGRKRYTAEQGRSNTQQAWPA